MSEKDKAKSNLKKNEPKWKPDKSQILTIEESIAKKEREKEEKKR